jgi:hypothetical protein
VARELPPELSDGQRAVLSQFFAGHISAGQLSQRLALDNARRANGQPAGVPSRIRGQRPATPVSRNGHRSLRFFSLPRVLSDDGR